MQADISWEQGQGSPDIMEHERAPLRVLLADDSDRVRRRLTELLSRMDGVIVCGQARDGREAVDGIAALEPDVVVLDLRMPAMSGFEVLEVVKEFPRPPAVVVLTNLSEPAYRTRCLAAGADYFLDKSMEFDRVPEVLREIMSRRETS